MSATANHPARSPADHARLTFRYTPNPDGWVTAQIVEFPEAISQGASEHEAYLNVLEALHDLTHEPTVAERLAFAAQARFVGMEELVELVEPWGRRLIDAITAALHDVTRPRVR
jgi:hypothetical protein